MRDGTWEEPMNVYQVCVAGPAGVDWLQVRGRDESEARGEVAGTVMPGVDIVRGRKVPVGIPLTDGQAAKEAERT